MGDVALCRAQACAPATSEGSPEFFVGYDGACKQVRMQVDDMLLAKDYGVLYDEERSCRARRCVGIDGHKAKVISVCIQQWKKGDVRLGSGHRDHVGSKLMVVKRKDGQALVSLAHRAGEANMPNHRKTFGNEEDAASMRLATALMTRAGGDVPDGELNKSWRSRGFGTAVEVPQSAR